jgi:hypothetical protein
VEKKKKKKFLKKKKESEITGKNIMPLKTAPKLSK